MSAHGSSFRVGANNSRLAEVTRLYDLGDPGSRGALLAAGAWSRGLPPPDAADDTAAAADDDGAGTRRFSQRLRAAMAGGAEEKGWKCDRTGRRCVVGKASWEMRAEGGSRGEASVRRRREAEVSDSETALMETWLTLVPLALRARRVCLAARAARATRIIAVLGYPLLLRVRARARTARLQAAAPLLGRQELRLFSFFAQWPKNLLDDVAPRLVHRMYPPGRVVFTEGTPLTEVFFVRSGTVDTLVRCTRKGNGAGGVVAHTYTAYDTLGDPSARGAADCISASAWTRTDTHLLSLPTQLLERLWLRLPEDVRRAVDAEALEHRRRRMEAAGLSPTAVGRARLLQAVLRGAAAPQERQRVARAARAVRGALSAVAAGAAPVALRRGDTLEAHGKMVFVASGAVEQAGARVSVHSWANDTAQYVLEDHAKQGAVTAPLAAAAAADVWVLDLAGLLATLRGAGARDEVTHALLVMNVVRSAAVHDAVRRYVEAASRSAAPVPTQMTSRGWVRRAMQLLGRGEDGAAAAAAAAADRTLPSRAAAYALSPLQAAPAPPLKDEEVAAASAGSVEGRRELMAAAAAKGVAVGTAVLTPSGATGVVASPVDPETGRCVVRLQRVGRSCEEAWHYSRLQKRKQHGGDQGSEGRPQAFAFVTQRKKAVLAAANAERAATAGGQMRYVTWR